MTRICFDQPHLTPFPLALLVAQIADILLRQIGESEGKEIYPKDARICERERGLFFINFNLLWKLCFQHLRYEQLWEAFNPNRGISRCHILDKGDWYILETMINQAQPINGCE